MLKGYIDNVGNNTVSGWVFAEQTDLRGSEVLAFLDGVCVGSGRVDLFRQDLADAGLGDGFCGFHFGVTLPKGADRGALTVRVAGSDAALIQAGVRITSAEANPARARFLGDISSPVTLQWMADRGWLTQSELDFMKFLSRLGVYSRNLRKPRAADAPPEAGSLVPSEVSRDLLGLWAGGAVEVEELEFSSDEFFGDPRAALRAMNITIPVYAVHALEKLKLEVAEGSHLDNQQVGFVEYQTGREQLLFLSANAGVRIRPGSKDIRIKVLTATLVP